MNKPDEYEKLERAHAAAGLHMMQASPRADELIACLEGEIAKRDARIVELESELVLRREDHYRMDAELAAIKAQEPVGFADITIRSLAKYKSAMHCLPMYAAPVSEAKAQGVVMPERIQIAGHLSAVECYRASGWNQCLDEVARLNANPVQQVSVPDGWKLVPVNATEAILDVLYSNGMDESDSLLQDIWSAMIAAAPAAPAADAVLTASEWTKDAVEWGGALNYAAWEFVNQCPEKSALLFNNTKGPLRAAIMKYAEIVAAHRAKGVV